MSAFEVQYLVERYTLFGVLSVFDSWNRLYFLHLLPLFLKIIFHNHHVVIMIFLICSLVLK